MAVLVRNKLPRLHLIKNTTTTNKKQQRIRNCAVTSIICTRSLVKSLDILSCVFLSCTITFAINSSYHGTTFKGICFNFHSK
uniref:Putative ovule protein n=1 Tax=Solanum chacoense TaxID=4108 RepID=A0A0V0GPM3_SOLCH